MHRLALMGDMDPGEMYDRMEHQYDQNDDVNNDADDPPDDDTNTFDEMNVDNGDGDVNDDDDDGNEHQVEFNQNFDDAPSYHNEDKDPVDIGMLHMCIVAVVVTCFISIDQY